MTLRYALRFLLLSHRCPDGRRCVHRCRHSELDEANGDLASATLSNRLALVNRILVRRFELMRYVEDERSDVT